MTSTGRRGTSLKEHDTGGPLDPARWVELPVSQLVMADWNYKEDDPVQTAKLAANVKRNGQVENILVRQLPTGYFEVVNGNHRLAVFSMLGMATAVCYNLGTISDAQARRIAIETNETKFRRDDAKLALLIKEITADSSTGEFTLADLETTMPFSGQELDGLIKMPDFDWGAFEARNAEEMAALEAKRREKERGTVTMTMEATCPKCGHKFTIKGGEE